MGKNLKHTLVKHYNGYGTLKLRSLVNTTHPDA
jgi:hypothetical protein